MAKKTPETFARTPYMIMKPAHQYPAERLAHLVMLMTPLFCAKIDSGKVVVQRKVMTGALTMLELLT